MATTAPSGATARAPRDVPAQPPPRLPASLVERPRLLAMLDHGASVPVTLICAPAGSGKTMLLSSWLRRGDPPGAVAWVGVERDETDAMRFWGQVVDALRGSGAIAAADPLATLAPAPAPAHEEFLARLLEGLGRLSQTVLLVIDDLHHLQSDEALRGLEHLLARSPDQLRTFVVSRRDPKLGLHRLRLAGELVEIRAAELGFTPEEAGELMTAAGVTLAPGDVARLHHRTEGWAAGLRLAAMSLARHGEPDRFVAEFSGSERTVADYLVGEVLASQPPEVRRLLLRTCILERVNGPLADLLTGRTDGARLLHELEEANALVVAVDVARSWFRYHHLLGDLLRLELRHEAPEEVETLHRLAAGWFADHGHATDAIRHAKLGRDWETAVELLGRHWVHLVLDGEEATLDSLLAGLPDDLAHSDAEVATIMAAGHLAEGRWAQADALLGPAERALPSVPDRRRRRARTALMTARLFRARRLGDLESVVDDANATLQEGSAGDPELQALALLNLGIAETWTLRLADAEAHLRHGLALGREIGRPYMEISCLTALGGVANITGRLSLAEELLRQAIAVAERVGWSTHPTMGVAYMSLGACLLERGMIAEGAELVGRAEPILERAPEPAATVSLRHVQGVLRFARGRYEDALEAFRDGERLTGQLRAPHFLAAVERQWQLRALLRLGETETVREALAGDGAGAGAQRCNLEGHLHLVDGDAEAAAAAVAGVLDGSVFAFQPNIEIEANLIDGLARSRLGDGSGAERAVERSLALAEPQGRIWIFSTVPGVGDLLAAHASHRTAHGAHLKALLDHLAGAEPTGGGAHDLPDPLSERELAVLRFLPTNLSANEIGGELFLSVHTVKTHMRKLYAKLDVHTRAEAVQRGRALGLLAPARRGD